MKKINFQQTLLAAIFIMAGSTLYAEELNPKIVSIEAPSLDLLLYLGEFQDRDGSLLEPAVFDDSLKLKKDEKNPEDPEAMDAHKQQLSKIKKEDDNEQSQP